MPETRPITFVQGLRHRLADELVHVVRPGEAHFVLGRVHVDIHLVAGNIDKQHRQGELAFHQALGIALEKGVLHQAVAHAAPVDQDEDAVRRCAADLRA